MDPKQIICLEEEGLKNLIDRCVSYIKDVHNLKNEKWVTSNEAMKLLGITSPTTLLQARNSGAIRFSQPWHKVILYDRESIEKFLEKHARNTF